MAELKYTVRKAKKCDCPEIQNMIMELAETENMADQNNMTVQVLERDGFEKDPPYYYAFVAEKDDGTLLGYAVYVYQYSTWNGRIMYLEDICVKEAYRNQKVGFDLLKAVNKVALETGCSQMRFACLKTNPAMSFYKRHGALNLTEVEDWHMLRFDLDVMKSELS
uniref:SSAT-1 spermidine/spermine N1-acetyltransferase 1 n=1 Tax=Phallusia mammillata TaxID=59560 RepID=A0A6F9DS95_9ASCI|nr:SSAT-1 spermidine/spermine N1-acetyltransferase 1 [Phallusia mammillata]